MRPNTSTVFEEEAGQILIEDGIIRLVTFINL